MADPPAEGANAARPAPAPRPDGAAGFVSVPRGPRWQWPLSLVLVGLVAALTVVAMDHFRRGSVLFAAFVVLAFFLRLLLSEQDAGLLAVRSRRVDLACLGVLGLGLSVFALIVPPPS